MNKREQVQKEALDIAIANKRVGLAISMGVGKTLIGLKYIEFFQYKNDFKLKILVVAPKLSIFDSWKSDANKFAIELFGVEFITYLSLNKHDYNEYDIVILDECHTLLESHLPFLSGFSGRILGLTGTPPRFKNSEKGEMVDRFCPIKYRYIVNEAVDDFILNDYKIKIHMLPLSYAKNIKVETKKGTFYSSEIQNYEYWTNRVQQSQGKSKQIASVMRMKQMMEYKTKEYYTKQLLKEISEKCIVFANTIAQARNMCEHSYDSENPNSDANLYAFSEGNISKLSCVLQLNEGINIKNLKEGIIMHAYGNERKSSQRIGRLLRLNPDETAMVHILCYAGTVDEKWVKSALQDFDQDKIEYINLVEVA